MANPNPKCPKCHGTGWALKLGTQTQAPCADCNKAQPVGSEDCYATFKELPVQDGDDDFEDGVVGGDVISKEFTDGSW